MTGRLTVAAATVGLGGFLLLQPWGAAVLRMTGNLWRDQAEVPLFLFWYTAAFVLAALVGRQDPPLGLLLAYVAALGLYWPSYDGVAVVQYTMAAALFVLAVRALARHGPARRALLGALILSAVAQALYAGVQAFGYDPAWFGTLWRADMRPIGSVRNTNMLAIYLAVVAPLAPVGVAVVLVAGIALTKSALGLVAAAAGLLVAYRARLRRWPAAVLGLGALATAAALHYAPVRSVVDRAAFWRLGLEDLAGSPLFGWGLGGWAERVTGLYAAQQGMATWGPTARLTPTHAHNELVQWLHEGGIVGGLIVLIGLVWHRRLWAHPAAGGAVVAALVTCLGHAPLHLAITAVPILVVYAVATSPAAREYPRVPELDPQREAYRMA